MFSLVKVSLSHPVLSHGCSSEAREAPVSMSVMFTVIVVWFPFCICMMTFPNEDLQKARKVLFYIISLRYSHYGLCLYECYSKYFMFSKY